MFLQVQLTPSSIITTGHEEDEVTLLVVVTRAGVIISAGLQVRNELEEASRAILSNLL